MTLYELVGACFRNDAEKHRYASKQDIPSRFFAEQGSLQTIKQTKSKETDEKRKLILAETDETGV